MYETFFNPAVWLPLAALAVAVGVFVFGNNRVQPRVRNVGIGLVVLVLGWCAAAYAVNTPVEQCVDRTRAIVRAIDDGDWKTLATLIDSGTRLEIFRGPDDIAPATEQAAGLYGLKDIRMMPVTVNRGPGTVDVGFSALLEGTQPTTSVWRFEFETPPSGILLTRIVPVSIGNVSTDQIRAAAGRFK